MKKNKVTFNTIDEYIAQFPSEVQVRLQKLREVIIEAAPGVEERISYQMPAFVLKGNLVYFAAYKNHIGFYPTSSGIQAFQDELSQYKGGKGTVQFPIDEPLPLDIISRIVKFRVDYNIKKAADKGKKKN
ncbi:iron chaperone [Rummeliibacillus sp. NPDC094406]|uniref:iron chaperone n=1 Tax=Rummeliibacillus sp. NPDC094406 TaxID=3364511 RepID=UPI0037FE4A8A